MSIFSIHNDNDLENINLNDLKKNEYTIIRFFKFDAVNKFLKDSVDEVQVIQMYKDLDYFYILIKKL